MNIHHYPMTIRELSPEEGTGFLVTFPDIPGCMADGETIDEAIRAAEDALKSWLATAQEFGDYIPAPQTSEKYSGQFRLRIPKTLHAILASQAKKEGVSLNLFAATLLASGLGQSKSSASIKSSKKTEKYTRNVKAIHNRKIAS